MTYFVQNKALHLHKENHYMLRFKGHIFLWTHLKKKQKRHLQSLQKSAQLKYLFSLKNTIMMVNQIFKMFGGFKGIVYFMFVQEFKQLVPASNKVCQPIVKHCCRRVVSVFCQQFGSCQFMEKNTRMAEFYSVCPAYCSDLILAGQR